jgi:diamine N-acetyltransferase
MAMGVTRVAKAFVNEHYQVTPTLALTVLRPYEAGQIGVMLASMEPWARYPVTAAELTAFFSAIETNAPRFAIRVDGVLEGAIAVRANWFCGPYIQTFALSRNLQGRGIGSAVMGFVENQAITAGDRNLWVAASDFNTGAQRFYERHGYARVAEIDGLLRDNRTEILMRKPLSVQRLISRP